MVEKKSEDKKDLDKAGYMGKLVCVFCFFVIVYGRMIYSTLSDDSGFSRK